MNFWQNKNEMKVLVICSKFQPEYSGSGFRAHSTYKRLKKKYRVEYDVLTNSIEYNDNLCYEYDGVSVTRVGRKLQTLKSKGYPARLINHFIYLLNFLYQGFITLKLLKSGNYDLIHTFGSSISVNIGALYAKYRNKALIREICNNGTDPEPFLPFNLRRIIKYNFTDKSKIVAISKRIWDFCRQAGVPEDRLWERPNPVNEFKFTTNGNDKSGLRKKFTKFTDGDIVMVDISKFSPGKNQIFLIEVMRHLEGKYKLLLVGPVVSDGPFYERDKEYFDRLIRKIKTENLDDRIQIITSFSDRVEEYIKLADVFVFPTLFEALGTPMLESIACGIPVVANKISGVTDYWINNGRSGFVCALEPAKFAECIREACLIGFETLKYESDKILEVASTKIVDEQYYKIMKALITTTSSNELQ